ncbi:hypothetical protein [Pantoea sp. AS142]|uniref:hypothetical protein n=1 Tax=Pantoea sp. AS142 TaxID=3081292 RepID=UPI00301AC037
MSKSPSAGRHSLRLFLARLWPHPLAPEDLKPAPVAMPVPLTRADLHQALQGGELLDIDKDDLHALLRRAEKIAQRRQFSG